MLQNPSMVLIINKRRTKVMTKNYIVKELINKMKERIPQGQNLANYLTDTLYMGKEAVYRRLRGEVAFTFDEIAVISH